MTCVIATERKSKPSLHMEGPHLLSTSAQDPTERDLRNVKLWKMLMVALRSIQLQKALPSGKLVQDSEMRFEDDLREAALRDADASRLLRNLCGDMYIDAAQLDNFVSSVRTIHMRNVGQSVAAYHCSYSFLIGSSKVEGLAGCGLTEGLPAPCRHLSAHSVEADTPILEYTLVKHSGTSRTRRSRWDRAPLRRCRSAGCGGSARCRTGRISGRP